MDENKRKNGFTLVELLLVIVILSLISAGIMIMLNPKKRINQSKDARIKSDIDQIVVGLQSHYTINQIYPSQLSDLATNKDLKTVPKMPNGNDYSYLLSNPCTNFTCNAAVYGALYDSSNVWCWRSSLGRAGEMPLGSCTAP